MEERRLRTTILCILSIYVKKSFCARGRDQTPESEGRHFVSLVDLSFPFLFSSWPFVVLRVSSWITLFFCCFRQAVYSPLTINQVPATRRLKLLTH
jgi:hypothetical protein